MSDLSKLLDGDNSGSAPSKKVGEDPVSKIVSILFKARSEAHATHLKQPVKTFPRHNAFGIFYENIVDISDTLYETWSGIHDAGELTIDKGSIIGDPIQYFTDMYNTIENLRKDIKESFIQNQIDTIQQEIAHALYRFKKITT